MSYIIVGLGGILGSIARYSVGRLIARYGNTAFPWATFSINILGAFMLGAVTALNISSIVYLAVGEGFLGAFTTFSTFMYEGFNLIHHNKYLNASLYICITIVLGILSFMLGYSCILKLM